MKGAIDNIPTSFLRLKALESFSKSAECVPAVQCFKRVQNILKKQEALAGKWNDSLLKEEAELNLAKELKIFAESFEKACASKDYNEAFVVTAKLRPVIDNFFENVMVMAEDMELRANRLELLTFIQQRIEKLADFSALQV